MNMNHKQHSEPFYISPKLFDNRRLKRRRCRWLERLRERQLQYMAQMQLRATAIKTDRDQRGRQKPIAKAMPNRWQQQQHHHHHQQQKQRRQVASHLPADITIDLLSDDDDEHDNDDADETNEQMEMPKKVKSSMAITLTESIILTSDDDNEENEKEKHNDLLRHRHLIHSSSPPPLAPLTLSETVEEVTVSLVPRSSTTANCRARARPINGYGAPVSFCNGYYPTAAATAAATGFLEVDVGAATSLPDDETTVHTVIANRIYELSLSKLREGLASSGMPEYSQDILPEQLQKLSPALRAKVAPLVAPMPPAPISLKLSSDLSISLISDDDDESNNHYHHHNHHHHQHHQPQRNHQSQHHHQQQSQQQQQQHQHQHLLATATGNNQLTGSVSDLVRPVVMAAAAEAHAAAKLLKQQQPQLSVVQHLQYAGPGLRVPVALALPVMAGATGATITTAGTGSVTVAPTPPSATTSRRRKLG